MLYRYRRIAISVFVLTTAAMMIQGYSSTQYYRAQGRLLIENERTTAIPGLGTGEQFYEDPEPYYQTQYKILRGPRPHAPRHQKLNLDQVPEFRTAKRPDTPLTLLSSARTKLMSMIWRRAEVPGSAEGGRDAGRVRAGLVLHRPECPILDTLADGSRSMDGDPGSHLHDRSAQAANALMDEYEQQNLAGKLSTSENMLEWLGKELANQQTKVEESERALADYRDKQNAMSLDERQNIVGARLNQLNEAATKAKMERVQKENQYTQIKPLLVAGAQVSADQIPVTLQSPQMTQLRAKLAELD